MARTTDSEWVWQRRETIIRDEYTCQECGSKGGPKGDARLHAHHKTPVANGGADELKNLETLCQSCHQGMHARMKGNKGHFETQYPVSDFLDAIEELGGLAGTSDVAEEVGCARDTAYKKLKKLQEEERVSSRKVGGALVWEVVDDDSDV